MRACVTSTPAARNRNRSQASLRGPRLSSFRNCSSSRPRSESSSSLHARRVRPPNSGDFSPLRPPASRLWPTSPASRTLAFTPAIVATDSSSPRAQGPVFNVSCKAARSSPTPSAGTPPTLATDGSILVTLPSPAFVVDAETVCPAFATNTGIGRAIRPFTDFLRRILIRQTGDRIVAARCLQDRVAHYTDNTLFTATLTDAARSDGVGYLYVLAYLNSAVVTRLYRFLSGEHGRPQAQIKIGLLRRLPFIRPTPAEIRRIERLACQSEKAAARGAAASAQQKAIDRHFQQLFARAIRDILSRRGGRASHG